MNGAVLVLYYLDFLLIGLLPKVFFKKDGKLNFMWWLTASPFLLCTIFITLSFTGLWAPFTGYNTLGTKFLGVISIPLSLISVMLIAFTFGTHRVPIALWHQKNDAPQHIVTFGAYEKIRHPFYSSFIIALMGALFYCPHWGTFLTLICGIIILTYTAKQEEKKFLVSQFAAEYANYMKKTGRFFPKWSKV